MHGVGVVRQGCPLSPLLFSLVMNDLLPSISDHTLASSTTCINGLLFADDVVLISHSSGGLQKMLTNLEQYCDLWCMRLNITKTKVMVCSEVKSTPVYYMESQIEVVAQFKKS